MAKEDGRQHDHLADALSGAGGRIAPEVAGYRAQLSEFDKVSSTPYYFYTFGKTDKTVDSVPRLFNDVFATFYSRVMPSYSRFKRSNLDLSSFGAELLYNTDSVNTGTFVATSERILRESYLQTNCFVTIDAAPATSPKGVTNMGHAVRVELEDFCRQIGTDKPDSFRETMRRLIPRFMWQPHDYPADIVPARLDQWMRELWSGYSPEEASLLISPVSLAEEKAPLHMVFQTAEDVEAAGESDLGYAIRTRAIGTTLDWEKIRAEQSINAEIPFFTFVLGGAITGEVRQAPADAHFDYAAAINDTMLHTFVRLQKEIEDGNEGPATQFMQRLNETWTGGGMAIIFARALASTAKLADDFDEVTILRGLTTRNFPWCEKIVGAFYGLSESRVMTAAQVDHIAAYLPEISEEAPTPEQSIEYVGELMGEEEVFSFKHKLHSKTVPFEIEVDLDTYSESMDITLTYRIDKKTRKLPFKLSFTGEIESFQLDLLEEESIEGVSIESLRRTALQSLRTTVERKREKERGRAKAGTPVAIEPAQQNFRIALLDKSERQAHYREQMELSGTGKKKARLAKRAAGEPDVVATADPIPEVAQRQKAIPGLTRKSVQELLDQEKIKSVSADKLLQTLTRVVNAANTGGVPLGKRVGRDFVGDWANSIKLSQINWTLDGGHTQIRIYVQETGGGNYRLVGILDKKGENQQGSYIKKIANKLRDEMQSS